MLTQPQLDGYNRVRVEWLELHPFGHTDLMLLRDGNAAVICDANDYKVTNTVILDREGTTV